MDKVDELRELTERLEALEKRLNTTLRRINVDSDVGKSFRNIEIRLDALEGFPDPRQP